MKKLLASLALLAACGGSVTSPPMPDGASPAATSPDGAQPATPKLLVTSPTDDAIGVSFTTDIALTFSTDMDAASTIAAVTVSPSVSCAGSVSGATYTCAHAAFAPSTQYTVVVHATATSTGGVALDRESSFSFTTADASVTSVAVAGTTGNEVRQGSGTATLTVTGQGLTPISSAVLTGTSNPMSVPATIVDATDTTITLSIAVTHGLAPGPRALVLLGASAPITVPNVVVVTSVHAAAGVGDDAASGTTSAPFATLRHALAVAGAGDTVTLADGTYSAGETWPAALPPTFANVLDGVHVVGSSTAGTILTPAPGSSGLDGLVLSGVSGATDLSIHGFQRGVVVVGGNADLERLHVYGNTADGLYAMNDASLSISHSEIDTNGASGLVGVGSAEVDVDSTYVHGNATGAYMSGTANFSVSGSRFDANGHVVDKTNSGVFLTGSASADIEAAVSMNTSAGIYSESAGSLFVEGSTIGNGIGPAFNNNPVCSGIVLAGTGEARIAGTESSSNDWAGIVVMGPPKSITLSGVKLHANLYTNGWFHGTGPLLSQVSLMDSQLSDASVGINYGDFVNLTVSSTSITNDLTFDLGSNVTHPDSSNTFLDCSFGSDAAPVRFPATTGTVTESSANGTAPNGPSWSIIAGTVLGAPFVLRHS